MIRMTRQADYGIVLLTHLAAHEPGTTHNARDVAGEVRLPLPIASKILKALARGGLLESHRGARGGYSLARPPETISVADIITAIEGPIGMTECTTTSPSGCDIEPYCAVRSNWQKINDVVRRALQQIMLSQMTRPLPQGLRLPAAGGDGMGAAAR